mmetsp:Transcript_108288/g.316755  ORF Transcript_108288/g.316755 Transcript_108288/m.316755 type:complete len:204 (+) Transcript_108288:1485-2096(+)
MWRSQQVSWSRPMALRTTSLGLSVEVEPEPQKRRYSITPLCLLASASILAQYALRSAAVLATTCTSRSSMPGMPLASSRRASTALWIKATSSPSSSPEVSARKRRHSSVSRHTRQKRISTISTFACSCSSAARASLGLRTKTITPSSKLATVVKQKSKASALHLKKYKTPTVYILAQCSTSVNMEMQRHEFPMMQEIVSALPV